MKDRVINTPDYAANHEYWVVRVVNGQMWFYGAYDDENKAKEVSADLDNGLMIEN